jgi:polyisoprenoid-binding protein YceI
MTIWKSGQLGSWFALAALLGACSNGKPDSAFANPASGTTTAAAQPTIPDSASQRAALRLGLDPAGSAARYRVREQLVGHDMPNDAIGETKSVTGTIAFDSAGKVIRQASRFAVDAGTFVSDKDRRDGFVKRRILESDRYPTVVLVPTDVRGVSLPLPTAGTRPIEITGDLTVRGVTRPTTWKGTAQFSSGKIAAAAGTAFTFADFQMEQPRVPVLLSVADTIKLEINFSLVPQK